jgi:hypothetical protein
MRREGPAQAAAVVQDLRHQPPPTSRNISSQKKQSHQPPAPAPPTFANIGSTGSRAMGWPTSGVRAPVVSRAPRASNSSRDLKKERNRVGVGGGFGFGLDFRVGWTGFGWFGIN